VERCKRRADPRKYKRPLPVLVGIAAGPGIGAAAGAGAGTMSGPVEAQVRHVPHDRRDQAVSLGSKETDSVPPQVAQAVEKGLH
jgi:hypothetical protein